MPDLLGRNRNIDLVIFDCDGVLIDSEMISARILIEQLALVGLEVDLAHVQEHFLGRSWTKVAAEIRRQHNLHLDTGFEEKYREELLKAFGTELRTTEGIELVLGRMGIPYCLATSSSPRRLRRSLEVSRLARFFDDRLFTASQVENGKPAPDLFLFAARSMGVDPQSCLVIEDSIPGLYAARAAGMEVWRFTGGSHLKGMANALPPDLCDIKVFDNWLQFFEMSPELETSYHDGQIVDGN